LANKINTQALLRKGQGHAAVFFRCAVRPNGSTFDCLTYGGGPEAEQLKHEVQQSLLTAQFVPAVYNHRKTYSYFYGTAVFWVADGKPHLRVYANQEKSELAQASDFVTPQSIFIPGHYYDPAKFPHASWQSDELPGTVEFLMTIDHSGVLKDVHLLAENPPGKGYGESALKDLHTFTWTPAFRNGRPVDSTTHLTYVFRPSGWHWQKF
jgi:hypothetical protein